MKLRNTNVATMVLWQGKDGEPGLDVSNTHTVNIFLLSQVLMVSIINSSKNTSYVFQCT